MNGLSFVSKLKVIKISLLHERHNALKLSFCLVSNSYRQHNAICNDDGHGNGIGGHTVTHTSERYIWLQLDTLSHVKFSTYTEKYLWKCFTLICASLWPSVSVQCVSTWHQSFHSNVCQLETKCITLMCDPPISKLPMDEGFFTNSIFKSQIFILSNPNRKPLNPKYTTRYFNWKIDPIFIVYFMIISAMHPTIKCILLWDFCIHVYPKILLSLPPEGTMSSDIESSYIFAEIFRFHVFQ